MGLHVAFKSLGKCEFCAFWGLNSQIWALNELGWVELNQKGQIAHLSTRAPQLRRVKWETTRVGHRLMYE